MDSINDVLNAAKQYCREHTSEATYQYYISDIKAVSFENSNTITLEIRNAFILSIVSDRYATTLKDAFKSVLGFDVDLKFVTPKEGGDEEGKEKKPSIHERLEINKRIIQEKQGKDKPERGADLGVRTV